MRRSRWCKCMHQMKMRAWVEKQGEEAQRAMDRNNAKILYSIICELSGTSGRHGVPIYDKHRSLLLIKEVQEWRWIEHCKETPNKLPPQNLLQVVEFNPVDDLPVADGLISTVEVAVAVWGLKNGKAVGMVEITPQMLKKSSQGLIVELTDLVNNCWSNAPVPEDWRRGMIICLPKKGSLSDWNNWHGITLSLGRILVHSAVESFAEIGWSADTSGVDNRVLNRPSFSGWLLKKVFSDFAKAFDGVHRRHYGILHVLMEFLADMSIYSAYSSCCIRTDDGFSEAFGIVTGVRKGCVLSPFLFLLVVDFVMRRGCQPGRGVRVPLGDWSPSCRSGLRRQHCCPWSNEDQEHLVQHIHLRLMLWEYHGMKPKSLH